MTGVPKKTTSSAAAPRKVPNGSSYVDESFRRATMKITPITLPSIAPAKIVRNVRLIPKNAPAISIIFTSPSPIPSRPRRRKYASDTSHRTPLPNPAPISASVNEITGAGGGKSNTRFASHAAVPSAGVTNRLATNPIAKPVKFTTSGRSLSRRSVNTNTNRMAENAAHLSASNEIPNASKQAKNRSPVSSSTAGYIAEIGFLHFRHLPQSSSQLTTGMLSYGRMGVPHFGQADAGATIDFSA